MNQFFSSLRRDITGGTIIEFAFVAPVFVVMLIGMFDISHNLYASSILQGSLQKAGRDFTIEGQSSKREDVEDYVTAQIRTVVPAAVVSFERKAYYDFADVGEPETYDDDNGDGICNNNEAFEDSNGNGLWDSDRGAVGFGGARDAVLFTANVSYARLFPMAGLIGMSDQVEMSGSTVLRNQPYDTQDQSAPDRGNCP